ncbi:hypothetical protein evm_005327 [Chilo suppressalis]|nr:hypothetical protein evm_005327 [Chilo suppressalis]
MENSNKIVPPHLNAEVYRSDTTSVNTVSYLEYLYLHPVNGVLIGCSELTGRYWNGGASIYKSVNEAQKNHNERKKCINLASGTTDGCFIGNFSKVLLCEDNGTVSVWSTINDEVWKLWSQETSVSEHDDAVLLVDCIQSEKEYVTAGADANEDTTAKEDVGTTIRNDDNPSSNTVLATKKRKKNSDDNNIGAQLAGVISKNLERKNLDDDDDRLFFLSLVKEFKKIPDHMRMQTKLDILRLINDAQQFSDYYANTSWSSSGPISIVDTRRRSISEIIPIRTTTFSIGIRTTTFSRLRSESVAKFGCTIAIIHRPRVSEQSTLVILETF